LRFGEFNGAPIPALEFHHLTSLRFPRCVANPFDAAQQQIFHLSDGEVEKMKIVEGPPRDCVLVSSTACRFRRSSEFKLPKLPISKFQVPETKVSE
jgi:hypothetical protein